MAVPHTQGGDTMDTRNDALDAQADQLVKEALHELGDAPLDEYDEYAEQCDFAGCYPWLAEVVCARPHDSATLSALQGDALAIEDTEYFC